MEKIFCDFCKNEIGARLSTVRFRKDFIPCRPGQYTGIDSDYVEKNLDLCPTCSQEFKDYLESKTTK